MARGGSRVGGTQDGAEKYKTATNVKELLDRIGEDIYKIANKAALPYNNDLHGTLSEARFEGKPKEQQTQGNPCKLNHEYHTNATNGKSYPCRTGKEHRFSDEGGAECANSKIKGNKGIEDNSEGACAPYRRLHLCVRNLENISALDKINNHTLLADVCLAALHEGQSITQDYPKYQAQYASSDFTFTMCTMLARSFADIGDIIRGKDLYLGGRGRDQLESKLKEIFGKIHSEVTKGGKNVKKQSLKERYGNDPNFFKLREDWWNANRQEVWYAITCHAGQGAQYFRPTCGSGNNATQAKDKCRCATNYVPTYFDYVPQYLRWFEEWAEDFCRIRKHKLQNAINKCRGKDKEGKPRYCDLNGYDCTKTARGKEKYNYEHDCIECYSSCTPFTYWIDNQKEEFEKQKKKYGNEIKKAEEKIETSKGKINNIYINDFYKILQQSYGSVNQFLQKLNEERICKDKPQASGETADNVDFTKSDPHDIFSHTKYCQACPWCGLQIDHPPWTPIDESTCRNGKIKTFDESNSTEIKLLIKDKKGKTMMQKLKSLCNNSNIKYQEWKCHYVDDNNDNCILQDNKKDTTYQTVESFYSLFWRWVTEMLKDSIDWRKEHENCINNNNTCKKGCKNKCDCFKKWVEKKQQEWDQIEQHYVKEHFGVFGRYWTLGHLLKEEYFPKINAPYKGVKSVEEFIKEMKKIIEDNSNKKEATRHDNSINKVLDHEKEEANKCKQTHQDPCPRPEDTSGARSATDTQPRAEVDDDSGEDDDDDDNDNTVVDHVEEEDTAKGATDTTTPQIDVCPIVAGVLTKENLKNACPTKYVNGREKFPNWKCIPSGKPSELTGESSPSRQRRAAPGQAPSGDKTAAGDTTGGLCIPPRRRRLYIQKLHDWASGNTQATQPPQGDAAPSTSSLTDATQLLRQAFIESAAVETFFLWHKYKQEKKKPQGVGAGLGLLHDQDVSPEVDPEQKKLQESGDIPEEFKRQMFYTLGDYRDICIGGDRDIVGDTIINNTDSTEKSSGQVTRISDVIKQTLEKSGSKPGNSSPPPVKTSGQPITRETWWNNNAKHIWNGMICALTYKDKTSGSGDGKTTITQDKGLKEKLWDDSDNKPKGKYSDYEKVKLEENSVTGGTKGNDDTIQTPTLKDFVEIPTFFRWLHEWGSDFCGTRKHLLEKIKHECKVDDNGGRRGVKKENPKCSCYGEDCETIFSKKYDILPDLECRTCGEECTKYKKWIEKKKIEFTQQSNAYDGQKDKCVNGNNKGGGVNGFCETLKRTCTDAAAFLNSLKNGPCKKHNGEGNGKVNNIFENTEETFKPAKDCKPCSQFTVDCKNGKCSNGDGTQGNCNEKTTIDVNDIENKGDSTQEVTMLVSDDSATGFAGGLEEACKDADIFKGIKENKWKCRNVCGYVVCKQEKGNGNKNGENPIITIRGLVAHWVQNFLDDYNKIKHRISHCTKKGEEPKCIKECVENWIKEKEKKWTNLKSLYLQQYENADESYPVRSILEEFKERPEFKNAIKPCGSLTDFESSCGLNGDASSKKSKNSNDNDLVKCLLKKLGEKAEKCKEKHSGETQNNCVQPPPSDDDDETSTDNDAQKPAFCPKEKEPPVPPVPPDACTIVDGILAGKNGNEQIGECKPKTEGDYPPWKCGIEKIKNGDGACMPPRRQKLCVHNLEYFSGTSKNDLRKAFIECAAIETFWLWHKYKTDKQNKGQNTSELDNYLKEGKIPEEFKRQMFYTFCDYRDLCLGKDIGNDVDTVKSNIKKVFENSTKNGETQTTAHDWWKTIEKDIWEGMVCGLSHHIKEAEREKFTNSEAYKYSTVSSRLEDFASRPQFLRWFTEWADQFCRERGVKINQLKTGCNEYECGSQENGKKEACKTACEAYKSWLQGWKDQYEKQEKKYNDDKITYENVPDVKNSEHAYQYLSKKLKPICQNGTTTDKCDYTCMENASRQPQTSTSNEQPENSSTENNYPEAFDYPPKEIGDRCTCPKLPEPKYCVDKTAYDIRKDAETKVKNMDKSMKGKGNDFNSECNKVQKNDAANGENSCNFDKKYKKSLDNINETCKGKGVDRLKIGQKWNSKYIRSIGKYLYIPPRRQHMCINNLNEIGRYFDINNLLKTIQQAAKNEGDDIIKKLSTQYPRNKDVICKAMKYSFADLGDIVRGTDIYKGSNASNEIERKLKAVFENIYEKWKPENKGRNKYHDIQSFRSAWWDANRKDIWKAMTCNAPYDAKIYITKEGGYISPLTSTKNHCGHKDDPPDYDYIPQPLRWISEWSETYCLAQKDLLESMKNCENCKKKNKNSDCEQTKYGSCMDCKKKCEEYKKFIEIWKKQFETQKKAYEEIYKRATTSNGRYFNGIDENTKNFVKKLKDTCKKEDFSTADKYLENASVCRRFKFVKTNTHIKNYAFHNTPLSYVDHCECAKKYDPFDECPVNTDVCNEYGKYPCQKKKLNKELENWTNKFVKNNKDKNKAVMVPPRRRQLCLIGNRRFVGRVNDEKRFKEYLLRDASSEAKMLSQYYNSDNEKALQAIKYSFADIGNIVKGDDMLEDGISEKIKNIFEHKINNQTHSSSSSSEPNITPSSWWEKNKEKIWYVMMCHYNGEHKTSTKCPSHNDIDNEDQFLRWMTEWAEYFCKEKKKEVEELIEKCKTEITTNGLSPDKEIKNVPCYKELQKYDHWLYNKKLEWNDISNKYSTDYNSNSKSTQLKRSAQEYVDEKCNDCKCNFDEIIKKYDTRGKEVSIIDILFKNDEPKKKCGPDTSDKSDTKPPPPLPPPPPVEPPPSDEPFDSTILQTTIPFGVALALGSIAFLFLKKKPKSPVDLLRVLDIHKGDYDIPTLKSKNRYIPYRSGTYKGKTYIYMEGDSGTDSGYTDHYSDITSSSESEYEELDINDIYVPGSPKYKTLIEVILEPSGNNTPTSDIPSDTQNDIPNNDTPSSKITDNEWNTLKDEFISQYLQSEQPNDIPNDYSSGDIPFNTQPNTLYFDKPEEKPFITSIHDRNLYSGEEYNYNVNMVNSMDDIPISGKNTVYSGIDLINDSLNSNNVDIYDEVLKRKENELFGTNHVKHTSTHSVAKLTNSDPIHNQLELFHKWLDRHRDMCEQWNNKEELLDKLKEEWNKDNNNSGNINPSGNTPPTSDNTPPTSDNTPPTSDIPSGKQVLNTDVSIQIHMDNPKPINQFTNMDTYPNNSSMDTILEDLDKPFNEPYYYDMYDDDIYYDVNDDNDISTVDSNAMDVPSKVQIEMDVNTKLVKEKYPIADVWDI